MELTPFTLDEAAEICEDFVDLNDTEFNLGTDIDYLVHDVVVCPFAEVDKLAFITNYFTDKDNGKEHTSYTGDACDVIVLAYDVDNETDFIHIGIRTYAQQSGIRYSFP